jgi:hypothetical protein
MTNFERCLLIKDVEDLLNHQIKCIEKKEIKKAAEDKKITWHP